MSALRIGVVHPGEMGGGIAATLVEAGHDVCWATRGRSDATRRRAEAAGLRELDDLAEMREVVEVIVSVCPPHAALEVARGLAGFSGRYLDANAIAPSTAIEVAKVIAEGGGEFIDGGIVGAPPRPGKPARIYLSGIGAERLATELGDANLDLRVLSDSPGDASALKVAYAAWTKGTTALLLAVRGFARERGVEEMLLAEWADSQPELATRSLGAAGQAASKGWRWIGEMEEIARAFADSGLPEGFHDGAAEIYRRVPRDESAKADAATLDAVLDEVSRDGERPSVQG